MVLAILFLLPCGHGQRVGRVTNEIIHAFATTFAKLTLMGFRRNDAKELLQDAEVPK
jgi:hypothetical protein